MKRTKDLCLATAMITLDMHPDSIEVHEEKGKQVAEFIFESTTDFQIALKKYWDGDLRIEPRLFYANLKATKNRIYELLNSKGQK